jgi:hypothetical protein
MLDSFHPRAGIVTVYGKALLFDVPSQICVTISKCEGWRTATSVMWQRIPELAVVAFYHEPDCVGGVAYTTDPGVPSGTHPFKERVTGKTIKSLMLVADSGLATGGLIYECFTSLNGVLEGTNVTNSSSGNNASTEEATVSFLPASDPSTTSNWLDPLPSRN